MRRAAVILGLLGLSAAAAPSGAAGATWSTPVNVSSPSTFIERPFIGFDRDGVGLAAWRWFQGVDADARSGVRTASQTAPGSFAPEQAVPDPLAVPVVYGSGHVFWMGEEGVLRRGRELTRVKVAFGRTDGRVGTPRTVDTVETFGISTADVNDAGQVALAYIQTTRSRRRTAKLFVSRGKRLGRSRIVSRRGGVNAVTVAVGTRGDIIVAWERGGRIEARIRRPGHRLGSVVLVGRGAKNGTRLRAAVAASGRAWIGWSSQNPAEGGTGPFTVRTAVSAPNRSKFDRPRLLDRYDGSPSEEASFDLGLDGNDNCFATWSSFDGRNFRARLASLDRTGRLARFTTLSQPGYDAAVSDLATSGRTGEALVVWSRLDAVGELGTAVLAGYLPAGGAYGGEEQVSTGDRARKPAVAFNPRTRLPTAVWSQREGPDGPVLRASTRSP